MLNKEQLLQLMKATAKATRSNPVAYSFNGENLSYEALNETLRKELNEYAGSWAQYRENKNMIFELIEKTMDEVLPRKIKDRYSQFAEVVTLKQGQAQSFKRKWMGRGRAKQFVTRVGLAGIYEVFKLGGQSYFEVPTSAIGGAAQIGFEEFLDARADFADVTAIIMEGMDELLQKEIAAALASGIYQLPTNNIVVANGFDEKAFDRLLVIASMYGEPTIYCDYEFAVKMAPSDPNMWTESMKQEKWNNNYFARYKTHPVVILPQGFVDETNTKKQFDAGYCWIIPAGADSKPVKIVFEGDTIVDEYVNKDRSREIQVYKKVGVGVIMTNDICCYKDSSLLGHFDVADMFTSGYNTLDPYKVETVNATAGGTGEEGQP